MKYFRYYFFFILFLVGGCDFLNYDETLKQSKDEVFNDFGRSKQFLTNIYSQIPNGFNQVDNAMRSSATDDAEEIQELSNIQKFNDGTWSAVQILDSNWSALYTGIRSANRFLEEFDIERFNDRKYNQDYEQMVEQARLYLYQARFLRALFYFKLVKRYEHAPLITKTLTTDEANNVQPSSYEEVTSFIVAECDSIIPHLPVSYMSVPSQETGRATRGAAMALKARSLLYAASPLHNTSGDIEKWKEAAEASKAIIDSSWYSLENNYSNVVNNRNSNELIFGRRRESSNSFEHDNFPIGYEGAQQNGTAPTQNLVDTYEMQSTGMSIEESGSGYDPEHPYQGRDPRLKKTIIVNNSQWKNRKVQIWRGGLDGLPQQGATETGYYLKKYVIESINFSTTPNTTQIHTWVLFRYGEVLLNYAEAMNEAYGPDDPADLGMSAREAVNKIRRRANMPDFPAGMTQVDFREKLHNERRVELAFEDHRFWDLRRWKIGPSTTDIEGMEIMQNDGASFSYQRTTIEQRVWEERMYLYPIPQAEIFKNEALQQNPGW